MANFYDSWRWHFLRRIPLRLYGHECMKCHATHNIEVDHIIARARGWFGAKYQYSLRNLQVLCHGCNREKGVEFADYRPWYWRLILPIRDQKSGVGYGNGRQPKHRIGRSFHSMDGG